jgi:RNA polymerase sigma-70 factor (ECF subfamily)
MSVDIDTGVAGSDEGGARAAFDRQAAEALPRVRGIVRRMIGHPEDSEDILQEALANAWERYDSFRGEAKFSTWLTTIASRLAVDHLRKAKRWRPEAQIAYANLSAVDDAYQGEIMGAYAAPDFSFEVREHIAYCFACVGRSLAADEQAALVLGDVADMSNRDAANALGVSESVFRHRLSAARRAMRDKYENLCALVSKTGNCHQCARAFARSVRRTSAADRSPTSMNSPSASPSFVAAISPAANRRRCTTSSGGAPRRSRRKARARSPPTATAGWIRGYSRS